MTKQDKSELEKVKKEKVKVSRKNRSGLPQTNIIDAINYVKQAYSVLDTRLTSFSGMAKAMGIKEGHATKAFGALSDAYGLIEKEGNGWKISDLGRRAVKGEKNAVIEILEKNKILRKMYSDLKDKKYDRDYVEDYIRKSRLGGINVSLVADKFLAVKEYIESLQEGGMPTKCEDSTHNGSSSLFFKIIKLKYALSPPNKEEIKNLVSDLFKETNKSDDIAIKSITEQMSNQKGNNEVLQALFKSLVSIVSQKYPSFSLEENKSESSDEESSEEN